MYCEKLTKQQLKDWGFTQINYLPEIGKESNDPKENWYIERLWRTKHGKKPILKRINVTEAVCKHKYSCDKKYHKVTFMADDKARSITLARLIYVWFIGDLEQGEVVDHINNNSFDNRPENLQKLSVGENLAKRNIDNAEFAKNQYGVEFKNLIKKLYSDNISLEEGKKLLEEYYTLKGM